MSDKWIKTNPERSHRRDEQDRPSPVTPRADAVKGVAGAALPRFVRAFIVAIGVIAGVAAPSLATAADETAVEFTRTAANEVFAEMSSAASLDQKLTHFGQLLRQDLDIDWISRFVLGPYWRTASPEQQEFRALLEKHIVLSHGRRLAEASGGDFRVTGSRTDPNGVVLVTGEIVAPQGARNEVDFQLGTVDGLYRVQDVVIDNVSMASSYRSKIQTVLASHGGQLGALLTAMREER